MLDHSHNFAEPRGYGVEYVAHFPASAMIFKNFAR